MYSSYTPLVAFLKIRNFNSPFTPFSSKVFANVPYSQFSKAFARELQDGLGSFKSQCDIIFNKRLSWLLLESSLNVWILLEFMSKYAPNNSDLEAEKFPRLS